MTKVFFIVGIVIILLSLVQLIPNLNWYSSVQAGTALNLSTNSTGILINIVGNVALLLSGILLLPPIFVRFSKKGDFFSTPNWYKGLILLLFIFGGYFSLQPVQSYLIEVPQKINP